MTDLQNYYTKTAQMSREERIRYLSSLPRDKKLRLIKERTKMTETQKLATPRYEYRFRNGDIFFSDKSDHQLDATADLVVDHFVRTVVKNRTGNIGGVVYYELFPPVVKPVNQMEFAINATVRLELNDAEVEVWSGNEIIATVKDGGNAQFDIWRLLSRLSRVGK